MRQAAAAFTALLDVDNTLLDNDRAKADLDQALDTLVGDAERTRFWQIYEAVRGETGVVDIPLTLARFAGEESDLARQAALADLFMRFPYERSLFPDALATIAHLRRLGEVVILSDGDPIFQVSKIWRAGLTSAVDGKVIVVDHKERRLAPVVAAYPAAHYLLVDDKPALLRAMAEALPGRATTVFVRKGHYARSAAADGWRPDVALDAIGDLLRLDLPELLAHPTDSRSPAHS